MGSLLTMQVSRAPCPLSYAHSKLPQTPRSAMHTRARGDVWKASPRPRLRAQLSSVFRPASKTSRTHMLSLWLKYKTSQWFFFFFEDAIVWHHLSELLKYQLVPSICMGLEMKQKHIHWKDKPPGPGVGVGGWREWVEVCGFSCSWDTSFLKNKRKHQSKHRGEEMGPAGAKEGKKSLTRQDSGPCPDDTVDA